jgi:hypothetical protein
MKMLKQMMMDNMVLRNACSDVFGRHFLVKERGKFIAFIQYKIGLPENDWFLYFRKVPYPHEYIKAFIQKLVNLDQTQANSFLLFHYKAYLDKQEFLHCLKLTLIEAVCRTRDCIHRYNIAKALTWTQQQTDLLQFDKYLKAEIHHLLQPTFSDPNDIMEDEVRQIAELISAGVHQRQTGI